MGSSLNSAIITDGLWRKSLSAIRALGKAGFSVSVMGDSLLTTGFWSHFTRRRILAATAAQDPQKFIEKLFFELETKERFHQRPVLVPMEDASLLCIAQHAERLKKNADFLLPPLESLECALDKGATLQLAQKMGIPCPRTWEPQTSEEFTALTQQIDSFVAKPRRGTGSSGILYSSKTKNKEQYQQHWEQFGKMLIQERIPEEGRGQGVSLLMNRDGECVAFFAHERLQQYPNSGGPSTDRQSLNPDKLQIVQWSINLLKQLSWRGIAMVEWKIDPRDGIPKLMEINPRFWGSLELAVRAGVNFPLLYAKAARREPLGPPPPYQAQVRCRWFLPGEILRYLTQAKAQREPLRQFLKGLPKMAEEWDAQDWTGTFASFICPAFLAFNPRYWKYLRRQTPDPTEPS